LTTFLPGMRCRWNSSKHIATGPPPSKRAGIPPSNGISYNSKTPHGRY